MRAREVAGRSTGGSKRSALGEEFVLIDHSGHAQLAIVAGRFGAHHRAFAAHSDALRERNFRRQSKGKLYVRALPDLAVEIEADAAGAHVAGESGFLSRRSVL